MEERLARLEREGRIWRSLAILAVALAASAYLWRAPVEAEAQVAPDQITAHAFSLTDKAGATRAWLGLDDEGTVSLEMWGADGQRTGVILAIDGRSGAPRLSLTGIGGGSALLLNGGSDSASISGFSTTVAPVPGQAITPSFTLSTNTVTGRGSLGLGGPHEDYFWLAP